MPSSTRNPSRPGEPCPDPSAHSHGDARLRDSASKTAMQYGSKTAIFGPDGKLSAASAAASLKYAKPHELPSFPSVGIDIGDADDYYVPPPSSQANRAAAIASSGEGSREWWKYKGSTAGQSAAGLAFAKNTSPQIDLGYTDEGRKKALMAATLSVNAKGRGRAPSAASTKTGTGSVYAANAKNLHMGPEMFTEHPPVAIEVEEKRHKDALRASAISMAQSIYRLEKTKSSDAAKAASRGKYASDTEGLVARSLNVAYPGLQEAAQKLANERLARLDPDGIMAYRQHYGYGLQGPTKLTVENVQKQERSGRNLDADSDEDEAQASKIRGQMSSFNAQLSAIDSKKRDKDRAALMAAAEKLVQARLHDMDEKVFHDTGKVPPSIMQSWEAAARAKATESSEQRMLTHGKVHVGGGKYMDQSEINAIAAARMQPILDETTATAQKQRERDEEMRLAQEERKKAEAEEKAKQQAEKNETKRKRDEEKLRIYQEKQVEKNKLQGERAELARVKAEEKAERDKVAAEEKNLRDIKNAELKTEKKRLEAEEKVKREAEKAEQRQKLADQRAAAAATTTTTTTTEEPIVTEDVITESVADEPATDVFVDTQSTLDDDVTSPAPLSLAKSQESVTGTASEEPVTEMVGTEAPPASEGGIARAIADRIMGEPATEWGARDEPLTEEYTEGKGGIDDDAQTIKASASEAVVTDGNEETVVPAAVAENIEEADGASTIKDVDDDEVSPGRDPVTATTTTETAAPRRIYGMPDTNAAGKERGSRRKSFFDKMSKFGKRGSKTPKPAETKPVVSGDPSVGPGIVGATEGGAAPSSIVHTPVDANGATEEDAGATTEAGETTDADETFESLYDEPTTGKGKDIDDDGETRGRSSYTSNERFEEANDQFDDALATPSGLGRELESSPARSTGKFQEEL